MSEVTVLNRRTAYIGQCLCLVVVIFCQVVKADSNELTMTPSSCVALNQGQLCYQTIAVNWQASIEGEYCLYQRPIKKPLYCWSAGRHVGKAQLEFEFSETVIYELKRLGSLELIAESEVEVTWVYSKRKRRRTSWRLF